MIQKPTPTVVNNGWFEVLFRFPNTPVPKKLNELQISDYMLVAGSLPYHEFRRPMEVYSLLVDGWEAMGLSRPIQAFDIFNMVHQVRGEKHHRLMPMLMLDECKHRSLMYSNALLDFIDGYPLVAMPLRRDRRIYFNVPSLCQKK